VDELELLVVVVGEDDIEVDVEDDIELVEEDGIEVDVDDDIEVVVEVGTVTVGVGVASEQISKKSEQQSP
jgi:hypothetical protein